MSTQVSREEFEGIPLPPELHAERTRLLFETEKLYRDWQSFWELVGKFEQETGTIQ